MLLLLHVAVTAWGLVSGACMQWRFACIARRTCSNHAFCACSMIPLAAGQRPDAHQHISIYHTLQNVCVLGHWPLPPAAACCSC